MFYIQFAISFYSVLQCTVQWYSELMFIEVIVGFIHVLPYTVRFFLLGQLIIFGHFDF